VLLRLAYLGVANVFALRLLPMSNRDKDAEILALHHQLSVLQRQLGQGRVRLAPGDRALLAALLHRLPRDVLERLHLAVRPDTVLLRWHFDMVSRRHARRPRHPGRPRTMRSIRVRRRPIGPPVSGRPVPASRTPPPRPSLTTA
jgi:hypothetical protein